MLAGAAQELSLPSKDVQAKDVQAKDVQGWVDQWAEFIRPSADELSYESIGWRNEFWPAVQLAQELGRPILLWTMNGHPLGCT
jgi:hypothetical protein